MIDQIMRSSSKPPLVRFPEGSTGNLLQDCHCLFSGTDRTCQDTKHT